MMADVRVAPALARPRSIRGRLISAPDQLRRRQTAESLIEIALATVHVNEVGVAILLLKIAFRRKNWPSKRLNDARFRV
jgi:hypothetical protein